MTCWAMLGLESAGTNPLDVAGAGKTPVDYLRAKVASLKSVGSLALAILALDGAGVDPRHLAGKNLVGELIGLQHKDGSFEEWPGRTSYAILALRGAGSGGAADAAANWLRGVQNPDGGWGDTVDSPSTADGTGAAMMALAGSKAAQRGIAYMKDHQRQNGGFSIGAGGTVNTMSTAWAVQGILAGGGSPAAFKRGGNSPLDYLAANQSADGSYRYATAGRRDLEAGRRTDAGLGNRAGAGGDDQDDLPDRLGRPGAEAADHLRPTASRRSAAAKAPAARRRRASPPNRNPNSAGSRRNRCRKAAANRRPPRRRRARHNGGRRRGAARSRSHPARRRAPGRHRRRKPHRLKPNPHRPVPNHPTESAPESKRRRRLLERGWRDRRRAPRRLPPLRHRLARPPRLDALALRPLRTKHVSPSRASATIKGWKASVNPRTVAMLSRARAIEEIAGQSFEVVVIGGGITGAGVALDAASRGYSVALLEKGDYAVGTSSRSSKMVHGGLRYLQNFDLGLVREALLERQLMVQLAPHLVYPTPFLVASVGEERRDRKLGLGLNMYDVMATTRVGRNRREQRSSHAADEDFYWSPDRHRTIDREEVLELVPALAAARASRRVSLLRLPDR